MNEQIEYSSAIDDTVTQERSEGLYATQAQLLDHVDAAGSHADIFAEHPDMYYTALPLDAFSKAAAPYARVYTYLLASAMPSPIQILRNNPGRRAASLSIVGDNTQPPILLCPSADVLQGLASRIGTWAVTNQNLAGPFLIQPVGQQAPFSWLAAGDLFACQPFVTTNPLYIAVTEYYDA